MAFTRLKQFTSDFFGGFDMPVLSPPPRAEMATQRVDLEGITTYDVTTGRSFLETRKRAWQEEGWRLSREVGEWGALLDWKASALSRIRFYVAEVPKSGDDNTNPEPVTSPVLTAPLDAISGDDPNGLASKLTRYWKQTAITGESYLVGYRENWRDPDSARFDFVSADELTARVMSSPDGNGANDSRVALRVDEDQYIGLHPNWSSLQRMWRRDAQYGWLAWSATEHCLPILRVLRLLDLRVSAEALSRIWTSGILCIGEGNFLPMPPPEARAMFPGEDPQMQTIKYLLTVATKNPGEASSVAPIVLNTSKSDVGMVELATEFSKAVPELTELYIRRLAMSVSAPPEMILGRSDTKFMNSFFVDKDAVEVYLKDDAADFASNITTGHLRPWYRAVGVRNPERYMVAFDVSPLIEEPNRAESVEADYTNRAIGAETYRRIRGYDEKDAPTPAENRRWLLEQLALSNADPVQVQPFLEDLGITLDTEPVAPAQSAPANAPGATPPPDAEDTPAPPPAPPAPVEP